MTRKKVKLAYIANDSARKATFKKRKKGLMKKVSELSTLCGIDACAIVYSPYDSQPEVWPSQGGAQRVVSQFKKMPEMEQSKKMVNQESFLRQRIAKANEQLKKQRKDNREKEMTQVMYQSLTGKSLHNLNMMDLNDLGWLIEQNLKEIHKRCDSLNKNANNGGASSSTLTEAAAAPPPPSTPPPPPPPSMMIKSGSSETAAQMGQRAAYEVNMDTMQRQQQQPWFMDPRSTVVEMVSRGCGSSGDGLMVVPASSGGVNEPRLTVVRSLVVRWLMVGFWCDLGHWQ